MAVALSIQYRAGTPSRFHLGWVEVEIGTLDLMRKFTLSALNLFFRVNCKYLVFIARSMEYEL